MTRWWLRLYAWLQQANGQGMVEYGFILTLVALVVLGALVLLGSHVSGLYDSLVSQLQGTSETVGVH